MGISRSCIARRTSLVMCSELFTGELNYGTVMGDLQIHALRQCNLLGCCKQILTPLGLSG